MDEQQRWLLNLDIAHAAQIGQMQPGEFLSLGVSSGYTFNISCYQGPNSLLYAVELARYGVLVDGFGHSGTSLWHALDLYADACITDFD